MENRMAAQQLQLDALVTQLQRLTTGTERRADGATERRGPELQGTQSEPHITMNQNANGAHLPTTSLSPMTTMEAPPLDTKALGKPDLFHGDRDKYPEWAFVVRAYMTALNPNFR